MAKARDQQRLGTDSEGSRISRRNMLKGLGLGAVALAGCADSGSSGKDDDEITVGLMTYLSGRYGFFGERTKEGAELAIHEIEEADAFDKEIKMPEYDTQSEASRTVPGFESLLSQGADAIMGGPGSSAVPNLVDPVENEAIPTFITGATTSWLDDKGGDWLWRTQPSDTLMARSQPLYAIEQGHDSMAIGHIDRSGAEAFANEMGRFYTEQGGSVTGTFPLPEGGSSYQSEIEEMVNSDPDVIVVEAGVQEFPTYLQTYRQLGVDIPLWVGAESSGPSIFEALGDNADLMDGVKGVGTAPADHFDEFDQKYQDVIGRAPDVYSDTTYDAMNILALAWYESGEPGTREGANEEAIRSVAEPSGTTVTSFPEGMAEIDNGNEINYQGANNPCDFDEYGQVSSAQLSVLNAESSEWNRVKVYESEEVTQ